MSIGAIGCQQVNSRGHRGQYDGEAHDGYTPERQATGGAETPSVRLAKEIDGMYVAVLRKGEGDCWPDVDAIARKIRAHVADEMKAVTRR